MWLEGVLEGEEQGEEQEMVGGQNSRSLKGRIKHLQCALRWNYRWVSIRYVSCSEFCFKRMTLIAVENSRCSRGPRRKRGAKSQRYGDFSRWS